MLALITNRLNRRVCDDVLEVAWSTMWNITDETVENCQRFLAENGMELFLACLSVRNFAFIYTIFLGKNILTFLFKRVTKLSSNKVKKKKKNRQAPIKITFLNIGSC